MFAASLKFAVAQLNAAVQAKELRCFALIGGLAVSRWASPRSTTGIDFAIIPTPDKLDTLAARVNGQLRRGSAADPLAAVINFTFAAGGVAIPIQLIEFPPAFSERLSRKLERLLQQ